MFPPPKSREGEIVGAEEEMVILPFVSEETCSLSSWRVTGGSVVLNGAGQ